MRLSEKEYLDRYLSTEEKQRLSQLSAEHRAELLEHLESLDLPEFDESAYPLDESVKNVLVFANLPRVGEAKFGKLLRFLEKVTSKFGTAEISMPSDSAGVSFGVAMVSFSRVSEALKAQRDLQDFELDADHRLRIFPLDQAADLLMETGVAESSTSATSGALPTNDRSCLADFMGDERYREELLIRFQTETQICWWDSLQATGGSGEPLEVEYAGERASAGKQTSCWCEGPAFFSPRGSYVVTAHPGRGVQLWGGRDFERKIRLLHSQVTEVLFAPDEEHVLVLGGDLDDPEGVKLFRVLTGEVVRVFPGTLSAGCAFQWSPCGQYLGKIVEKTLFVYAANDQFKPLAENGKLVTAKYVNCTDFVFCSSELVAIWTSEGANVPARLAVMDLITRRELASKTFFSTEESGAGSGGMLNWNGRDTLTLRTTRLLKKAGTTKKLGTAIDMFVVSTGYGRGSLAVENFSADVEGAGLKTAVGIPDGTGRLVAVYEKTLVVYKGEKGGLVEQSRVSLAGINGGSGIFDKIAISQFAYAVVYGPSGDLAFVSLAAVATGSGSVKTNAEILRVDQHYLVNRVTFDPSGRFVLSAVVQKMHDDSAFRVQQEAGFAVWTFQGRPLYRWKKERLYNVQWRPHAKEMLAADEKKKILAELKLREKQIEQEEETIKGQSRDSAQKSIAEKRNSFYATLDAVDKFFAAH